MSSTVEMTSRDPPPSQGSTQLRQLSSPSRHLPASAKLEQGTGHGLKLTVRQRPPEARTPNPHWAQCCPSRKSSRDLASPGLTLFRSWAWRRRPGRGLAEEQTGGEMPLPTCCWGAQPCHPHGPAPAPGAQDAPASAAAHTHIPVPFSAHTLVPFPSRPFAHTYLCAWHQDLTPSSPSHPGGCLLQLVAPCTSRWPFPAQVRSCLPSALSWGPASSFWEALAPCLPCSTHGGGQKPLICVANCRAWAFRNAQASSSLLSLPTSLGTVCFPSPSVR